MASISSAVDGRRVKIEQPDPLEAVDLVQTLEQLREAAAPDAAVAAPHRRVLRDKDQFFGSGFGQRARFGENRLLAAAAKLPRSAGMMQNVHGWSQPSAIFR